MFNIFKGQGIDRPTWINNVMLIMNIKCGTMYCGCMFPLGTMYRGMHGDILALKFNMTLVLVICSSVAIVGGLVTIYQDPLVRGHCNSDVIPIAILIIVCKDNVKILSYVYGHVDGAKSLTISPNHSKP